VDRLWRGQQHAAGRDGRAVRRDQRLTAALLRFDPAADEPGTVSGQARLSCERTQYDQRELQFPAHALAERDSDRHLVDQRLGPDGQRRRRGDGEERPGYLDIRADLLVRERLPLRAGGRPAGGHVRPVTSRTGSRFPAGIRERHVDRTGQLPPPRSCGTSSRTTQPGPRARTRSSSAPISRPRTTTFTTSATRSAATPTRLSTRSRWTSPATPPAPRTGSGTSRRSATERSASGRTITGSTCRISGASATG